ncbi:hypothetical protein HK102_009015 [Quaeritorhiza haematococci]|nr:hypothetical protein HK102_009015 [Quaeritorhiza haematococci]
MSNPNTNNTAGTPKDPNDYDPGNESGKESRLALMSEDKPIQNQKWAVVSMVSPHNHRQKCAVHAFKVKYVCEDLETAQAMAKAFRDQEPEFNVYVMPVGKWVPWVYDPLEVKDIQYVQEELTKLIKSHREELEKSRKAFNERVGEQRAASSGTGGTGNSGNDGQEQEDKENPSENIHAIRYKIIYLGKLLGVRQAEYHILQKVYTSRFTDAERETAERIPLPAIDEIVPLQIAKTANPTESK